MSRSMRKIKIETPESESIEDIFDLIKDYVKADDEKEKQLILKKRFLSLKT